MTAHALERLLRRSRLYGIRVVRFADRTTIEKLVDTLIEDGVVMSSERQAVIDVVANYAVDIRSLPAESAAAAITG